MSTDQQQTPQMNLSKKTQSVDPKSNRGRPKKNQGTKSKFKPTITQYLPFNIDKKEGPILCVVCGDKSSGLHYKVLTCEGCKGFFRRTVQQKVNYRCKNNNMCEISMNTRNQCQACRFSRCVKMGMDDNLVLSEFERLAKKKLIEDNRSKKKIGGANKAEDQHENTNCIHLSEHRQILMVKDGYKLRFLTMLADKEHLKIICNQEFKLTAENKTVTFYTDSDNEKWAEILKAVSLGSTFLISFAKTTTSFQQFSMADQTEMVKQSNLEAIILCLFQNYNAAYHCMAWPGGVKVFENCMQDAENVEILTQTFRLAQMFSSLEIDNYEAALLLCILIFRTENKTLENPQRADHELQIHLGLLKKYETHLNTGDKYERLLCSLSDLSQISYTIREKILAFEFNKWEDVPAVFLQCMLPENSESTSTDNTPCSML